MKAQNSTVDLRWAKFQNFNLLIEPVFFGQDHPAIGGQLNLLDSPVHLIQLNPLVSPNFSSFYVDSRNAQVNRQGIVQVRSFEIPEDLCLKGVSEWEPGDEDRIIYGEWENLSSPSVLSMATCALRMGIMEDVDCEAIERFMPENCGGSVLTYCWNLAFGRKYFGLEQVQAKPTSVDSFPGINQTQSNKNIGYIYLIKSASAIKVGFSQNPESRLANLQSASPSRLELIGVKKGTLQEEQSFHAQNKNKAVIGEWYPLSCLQFIKTSLGFKK
jgi:hypothetical protein